MSRPDPHSYADDQQPRVQHYRLDLKLDFSARRILGEARLELDRLGEVLDLDTRGIELLEVTGAEGVPLRWELGDPDPVLGTRLRVHAPGAALRLRYRVGPEASALQWLTPAQTAGGVHPFVYTQCQAIHARSLFPCQDTPRVRSTYRVYLETPAALRAVLAAESLGRTGQSPEGRAVHSFRMPQPIPSYLFAFAAGELDSAELGPRSRIYAEPSQLQAAAEEFSQTDALLQAAEALFGPYRWDRYDMLLMPPSFPYGGMENPRLTFLTPTLLAGDKSLTNVVAHELAHSWTGNLVTNASANDFWLNEGFTVYAERRILETVEGAEQVSLQAALGMESLREDMARLSDKAPELTRLRNELQGYDPDDVYSSVPYEKGYLFVRRLEENVGRARFDAFLAAYIEHFAFQSITTETFLAYVRASWPDLFEGVDVQAWVDQPGLPDDAPAATSPRLEALRALAAAAAGLDEAGAQRLAAQAEGWNATEWQVYLSALPERLPEAACAALDQRFGLSSSDNYEIRVGFLSTAAASGYAPALAAAAETVQTVGRMKYLRPLYQALLSGGPRAEAETLYQRTAARYHPVAQAMVATLVA